MRQTCHGRIFLRFVQFITGGVMLLSVTGFFDTRGHHFELFSHFRFQYLLLAVSNLILFLCMKSWKWSMATLSCVIINVMFIVPLYVQRQEQITPHHAIPIRLLYSNLNVANRNFSLLLDLIQTEQPDLVILLEPDLQWFKALAPLNMNYQYQHALIRSDGHGAMIYSRYPFNQTDIVYTFVGKLKLPTLQATLNLVHTQLTVLTTHPLPPVNDFGFQARNQQLREIVILSNHQPSPKLICGDLNTTMWSSYYRDFLNATGLINARQGFGIHATWPTPHYYAIWARKLGVDDLRKQHEAGFNAVFSLPLIQIPIDHCFVSSDIRITHIQTGKDIGSDHLPLILEFAVATGQARSPTSQKESISQEISR